MEVTGIITDEIIYKKYWAGESDDTVDLLVEKYGDMLTFYINGYIKDIHEAEDLMIEAFSRVFAKEQNGAANFSFLLIRGISAGALHILCDILSGFGISYVFRHRWLAVTGIVGILGACTGFHAIYNLLMTAESGWKMLGYIFPSVMILCLFVTRGILSKLKTSFK